ncbi:glycosyltransferase [Crateriforma spongiae]|uniref:glycosyltransferase n=1 Tax=Crateriforma spongiae TaxID=2724528 RepID=UPI001446E737|nr:glycosyltransferase [Crateriforma spongiae]
MPDRSAADLDENASDPLARSDSDASQPASVGATLRVTCFIHSLAGGGAERVMAALASKLATRHQVTLITLGSGNDDRHDVAPNVARVDLNVMAEHEPPPGIFRRAVAAASRLKAIRHAIVHSRPDVVLSFCDSNNVKVLLATKGLAIPVVVAERSDPAMQSLGTVGDRLRNMTYRRAAAVVAQTNGQAATLRQMTGREIDVIPSAVEAPNDAGPLRDECQRSRGDSELRILAVGRLETEKGFDRLIQAFALGVSETDQAMSLRIVGEGSQRDALIEQAERLGVDAAVQLPGWCRPIWPMYAGCDLFVLPSRYEGFPSALLEAMSVGVPCVSVDCPSGPREIIRDGENGWLVENTVAGIAGGITAFAGRPDDVTAAVADRARNDVRQNFRWDTLVDRFDAVLRRCAK